MSSQNTSAAPTTPTVLVDLQALRDQYGITYSIPSLYRLIRDGKFPEPIRFGGGRHGAKRFWRRADIEAALAPATAA